MLRLGVKFLWLSAAWCQMCCHYMALLSAGEKDCWLSSSSRSCSLSCQENILNTTYPLSCADLAHVFKRVLLSDLHMTLPCAVSKCHWHSVTVFPHGMVSTTVDCSRGMSVPALMLPWWHKENWWSYEKMVKMHINIPQAKSTALLCCIFSQVKTCHINHIIPCNYTTIPCYNSTVQCLVSHVWLHCTVFLLWLHCDVSL